MEFLNSHSGFKLTSINMCRNKIVESSKQVK